MGNKGPKTVAHAKGLGQIPVPSSIPLLLMLSILPDVSSISVLIQAYYYKEMFMRALGNVVLPEVFSILKVDTS